MKYPLYCWLFFVLIILPFLSLGQQTIEIHDWNLDNSKKTVSKEILKQVPANPIIHDIVSLNANASYEAYYLGDLNGSYKLRINPPPKSSLVNSIALVLRESMDGVLLSLDEYTNICNSVGCKNTQFIDIYGEHNGLRVIPRYIMNSGNEEYLKVNQSRLDVLEVLQDDILVFFQEKIDRIVITNGKTGNDGLFRPFITISTLGQINDYSNEVSLFQELDVCNLDRVVFVLDASASMKEEDRIEVLNLLEKTLNSLFRMDYPLNIDLKIFSSTSISLITNHKIKSLNDARSLISLVKNRYLTFKNENGSWTNWYSAVNDIDNDKNSIGFLFTDGISNGNKHGRTGLIKSLNTALNSNNLVVVNLSEFSKLPFLNVFEAYQFEQRLNEIYALKCKDYEPLDEQFLIHPNPSKGHFSVNGICPGSWQIKVYNLMNQVVFDLQIQTDQNSIELDLSHLLSGNYFLKATTDKSDKLFDSKIIILQ